MSRQPQVVSDDEFKAKSEALAAGKKIVVDLPQKNAAVPNKPADKDPKPSKEADKKKTKEEKAKEREAKAKANAEEKAKLKAAKVPKALTLHQHFIIDIRRYAKYMKLTEQSFGHELAIKETNMTVEGKSYPAVTIAVLDK